MFFGSDGKIVRVLAHYPGRHGDRAAAGDRNGFCAVSDLECQLAFEDVERVGVVVVNVRSGHSFLRVVAGLGDGHVVARDENADLACLAAKNRLAVAGEGRVTLEFVRCEPAAAGVRPARWLMPRG